MNIFIVLPAYNEADYIGQVIKDILNYGYLVVVVDDGSQDGTSQIATNVGAQYVLCHTINRGQGAALQTGTEFALQKNAEIIVHFDADGQYLTQEIEKVIEPIIKSKTDVVLGSRLLASNKKGIPLLKRSFILPLATIVNWLISGIKLSDAHCGFRALSKKAAEKIKIKQDKMSHATEYLQEISKHKLKYEEVPVTVNYHSFGQGIGEGLKIIKDLIFGKIIK